MAFQLLSQKKGGHGPAPSAVLKDSQVTIALNAGHMVGYAQNAIANGIREMYVITVEHLSRLKKLKKDGHARSAIIQEMTGKSADNVKHLSQ